MGFLAARCDRAAGGYRWTCAKPTGLGAWVSGKSEGLRETDRDGAVTVGKVRGLRETDRNGAIAVGKVRGLRETDRNGGAAVGKVRGAD